ncbi:PLP-dependent aminotransferase family protein [Pararhizobium sp. DWP3-4]|uniref:MocR-like pyridoxine biosynthesis transcription factor PdxR n=1 Tax=unclassified Pararhizobium TaxID=2643050 RepID=UPI003CF0B054
MKPTLPFFLDQSLKSPLAGQIYSGIRDAISDGVMQAGSRMPSWKDLAVQLGVSRGTVRVAYERLIDEQLIVSRGPAGTWVAEHSFGGKPSAPTAVRPPLPQLFYDFGTVPLPFQMGVPSQDAFPFKLWSRLMARSARIAAASPVSYPDPRGDIDLRKEIAAYLAIARNLHCNPSQVIVTAGFSGALGLIAGALRLEGRIAWFEEPGFPLTRIALAHLGVDVRAVPVDADGLSVAKGRQVAGEATLALVTPGQQAPLGVTMSASRRHELLEWAGERDAWIIEDDYLGELQLQGRAAPALASADKNGHVLHIGTFSKTISPSLRLGFLVVPVRAAELFGEVAACLAPSPNSAVQCAVTEFMADGHYLRHLRRMKRLYRFRQIDVANRLDKLFGRPVHRISGLSVRLDLPDTFDDAKAVLEALPFGLAPVPLSPWYMGDTRRKGLLLGITNVHERNAEKSCERLYRLIASRINPV